MRLSQEKILEHGSISDKESKQLDFKIGLDWQNAGEKLKLVKHIVAMANTSGGLIVFGVGDNGENIDFDKNIVQKLDSADIANQIYKYTNSDYDNFSIIEIERKGYKKAAICILKSEQLIVFSKLGQYSSGKIVQVFQKGDLYFRHASKSEKCNANDINKFVELKIEAERKAWSEIFSKISKVGPSNSGVLDISNGVMKDSDGSIFLDEDLIEKISFIKKGSFSNKGKPTLRLIGNVQPVVVSNRGVKGMKFSNNPNALEVKEEDILKQFPLTYKQLVMELRRRYTDFKATSKFYELKNSLIKNPLLARERFLYPNKPNGSKTTFYSKKIFKEFDKHYTTKK